MLLSLTGHARSGDLRRRWRGAKAVVEGAASDGVSGKSVPRSSWPAHRLRSLHYVRFARQK